MVMRALKDHGSEGPAPSQQQNNEIKRTQSREFKQPPRSELPKSNDPKNKLKQIKIKSSILRKLKTESVKWS